MSDFPTDELYDLCPRCREPCAPAKMRDHTEAHIRADAVDELKRKLAEWDALKQVIALQKEDASEIRYRERKANSNKKKGKQQEDKKAEGDAPSQGHQSIDFLLGYIGVDSTKPETGKSGVCKQKKKASHVEETKRCKEKVVVNVSEKVGIGTAGLVGVLSGEKSIQSDWDVSEEVGKGSVCLVKDDLSGESSRGFEEYVNVEGSVISDGLSGESACVVNGGEIVNVEGSLISDGLSGESTCVVNGGETVKNGMGLMEEIEKLCIAKSIGLCELVETIHKMMVKAGGEAATDDDEYWIPTYKEVLSKPPYVPVPKDKTGREGEEHAYNHYVEKYGEENVEWVNKLWELMNPYDIIVKGLDGNPLLYIEVKTTRRPRANDWGFYLSNNEYEFGVEKKSSYMIARVILSKEAGNSVAEYKDPVRLMRSKNYFQLAVLFKGMRLFAG